MAIYGLKKITDKILAEAQREADRILAEAQEDCDRIAGEYEKKAEQIRTRLSEESEQEGLRLIARAKSGATMQKRNLLMQTQSELIDEVFVGAMATVTALEGEAYCNLLAGLLSAALLEQWNTEQINQTLYHDEEAVPDVYEVLLNQKDRGRYGEAVVALACKKLAGKATKEQIERIRLADKAAAIDGGVVLRCGKVESNCSFSLLFSRLRTELEGEVARSLFEVRKTI